MRARALCLLMCSAVSVAGCSSAVDGRGSGRSPAPSATSTAPATPTAASGVPGLCAGSSAQPIVSCLRRKLSDFWSGQLNQVVGEPVFLTATPAQVPVPCRPGLTAAPAFTCRSNLTLYLNRGLLELFDRSIPHQEMLYAFASVQAHEIGHVVQYALRQPQIELPSLTAAQTRFIEQQADCLSGVWAYHAAQAGGFDKALFRRIAVRLITLISTNPEIQTHGSPAQRAAAIDRGLATGRPQSCKLITFS